MKKTLLILLVLLIVLAAVPISVQAADSDFDVTFSLEHSSLPHKGGSMRITINVYNNGSSKISWVDAIVNLSSPYYMDRWSGTIVPGDHETITMNVPFKKVDLDKDVWLQVSMNNDSDTNPDGVWMQKIRVSSNNMPVIERVASISPDTGSIYTGDTVAVGIEYTNATGASLVKKLATSARVTLPGGRTIDIPIEVHPTLSPGEISTFNFNIPIRRDEIGMAEVETLYTFAIYGYSYEKSDDFSFQIKPTIEITATLSAEPETIDIGDEVDFTLTLENNGDTTEQLNIFLPDMVELGVLAPGESVIHEYTVSGISMTQSFSVPLVAMVRTVTKRFESNAVLINVNPRLDAPAEETAEPEESAMPEATAEPEATTAPADKSGDEPQSDETPKKGMPTWAYVIIGIAAALIAAAAAASVIILKKKGIILKKKQG